MTDALLYGQGRDRCPASVELQVPVSRLAPDGTLTLRCGRLEGHHGEHVAQTSVVWPTAATADLRPRGR